MDNNLASAYIHLGQLEYKIVAMSNELEYLVAEKNKIITEIARIETNEISDNNNTDPSSE